MLGGQPTGLLVLQENRRSIEYEKNIMVHCIAL